MPNLFPEFEVPQMTPVTSKAKRQNVNSYYFDFEKGDFRVDGAGKTVMATPAETWKQWCIKAVNTERYRFRAYSRQYGAEWLQVDKYTSQKSKESWIERTITETLLADPLNRTLYVKEFSFSWDPDSVYVTFTAVGQGGLAVALSINI